MSKQLDLLEWAMSQPTAEIIDARQRFGDRIVEYVIAILNDRVPTYEGQVFSLADARQRAKVGPAGSCSPPPARASGPAA
ncbi:MAG: hypothetical protein BGO06_26210 [Shinella sp. 65-6]|nr:MAG: hypothetical protein BGO06_26210 [Shinella sp. 65-6]